MALEIRIVGSDGRLVPTMEDRTAPVLKTEVPPGSTILSDYCFNHEDGPWVKPQELLREQDVAAVVFSQRGQMESMVVGGRSVHDEQEMYWLLRSFHGTTVTRYPGKKGKEIFLFLLSPEIRRRISRPWRKKKPSK